VETVTDLIEADMEVSPRKQFRAFLERKERFAILVCHRRAGKTVACIQDMIHQVLTHPRQDPPVRAAMIAPTYSQVKDISWSQLKRYVEKIPQVKITEADLTVTFPSGAVIKLLSGENFERIRGTFMDLVVIDEMADIPASAWHSVIRPCLADYQGKAVLIGTPKGRNIFWKMWQEALNDPEWYTLLLTADESGLIAPEELAAIKRGTPEHVYEQEFNCSFAVSRIGAIYSRALEAARNEKRVSNDILWHKESPVYTAWDVGGANNQRVWCFQVLGDRIVMLQCLFGDHACATPTDWVARLKGMQYQFGCHLIPHDAQTRNGSLWEGNLLTAGLVNISGVNRQHNVWDGINLALDAFPRVSFNQDGCADGLDSLDNYHAKEMRDGVSVQEVPVHDHSSHAADAFSLAFQGLKQGLIIDRTHIPRTAFRQTFGMRQKFANR
jgi:hypothetical protein